MYNQCFKSVPLSRIMRGIRFRFGTSLYIMRTSYAGEITADEEDLGGSVGEMDSSWSTRRVYGEVRGRIAISGV